MKRWRLWLVNGVIAVLVVGHLWEIGRQSEHWPFSNYPMWARVTREWRLRHVVPLGVTAEEPFEEVKLTDPAYFAPMPMYYQRLNLERAARRKRDDMLRDYLAHYEQRRREGLHDGPPLRSIRLYEHAWTMERDASDVAKPEKTTLLYEYPPPDGGKAP
jgi:hypothetical protein